MKTSTLAYGGLALLLVMGRAAASDSSAQVTAAVNEVHYGPSASAVDTHPAPTGTPINDGEFLGTGSKSRAELTLPSRSVTRLGSNTIFNYTVASNAIDLQAGTLLFCKPKDARKLEIKTPAIMAGIVGTTGYTSAKVEAGATTYRFGIIEGEGATDVVIKGKTYEVTPGEELVYIPPQEPEIHPFDFPRMIKTSILFTGFKDRLPNQDYIDQAIADYNNQAGRGFIQQPGNSPGGTNFAGQPNGPAAIDSAQNAHGDDTPPAGGGQPRTVPPPNNSSYH